MLLCVTDADDSVDNYPCSSYGVCDVMLLYVTDADDSVDTDPCSSSVVCDVMLCYYVLQTVMIQWTLIPVHPMGFVT